MRQIVEISLPRPPLALRAFFAAGGVPLTLIGLVAGYQTIGAIFTRLMGGEIEGSLTLGIVIALAFTGIGGAVLYVFFVPTDHLRLDASARRADLTRSYPFGVVRKRRYDLGALPMPEVVWVRDTDEREGGFWKLRVTLPDGRHVWQRALNVSEAENKIELERLRDEIAALIDPAS